MRVQMPAEANVVADLAPLAAPPAASLNSTSSRTPSPSSATRSGGWKPRCEPRWRPATRCQKQTSASAPDPLRRPNFDLTPCCSFQGSLPAGNVNFGLGDGREALAPGASRVVARPSPAAAARDARGARRVPRKGHARTRHRDARRGQRPSGRGPDVEGAAAIKGQRRRVTRDLPIDGLTDARSTGRGWPQGARPASSCDRHGSLQAQLLLEPARNLLL